MLQNNLGYIKLDSCRLHAALNFCFNSIWILRTILELIKIWKEFLILLKEERKYRTTQQLPLLIKYLTVERTKYLLRITITNWMNCLFKEKVFSTKNGGYLKFR